MKHDMKGEHRDRLYITPCTMLHSAITGTPQDGYTCNVCGASLTTFEAEQTIKDILFINTHGSREWTQRRYMTMLREMPNVAELRLLWCDSKTGALLGEISLGDMSSIKSIRVNTNRPERSDYTIHISNPNAPAPPVKADPELETITYIPDREYQDMILRGIKDGSIKPYSQMP